MLIETQRGRGKVKVEELTLFTAAERKYGRGALFGVSRAKFFVLGVFVDRERAEEVYDEIQAANRAGKERYKVPEA